ncbi:MAG TPA: carotenoid biosynthesis protein [Mucilaginibacter sp.]
MERPQDIAILSSNTTRTRSAVVVIILFHLVGLAGFFAPGLRPLFLQIVPYHLLLMLLVIIFSHQPVNTRFMAFMLLIWVLGFIAEWIGIHTAWLFGSYTYGKVLGIKVSGVPLMIGVNWLLLIYSTGVLMQRTRIKKSWIRVTAGALILVLLDRLIEPVAIRFNYWQWANNMIPVKNYVCWFIVSGLLLFVFECFQFKKQSMVGTVLLVAQFIFFAVLIFLP